MNLKSSRSHFMLLSLVKLLFVAVLLLLLCGSVLRWT